MYINKKLNLILKYLICLIPMALLTGPFIPDLFVTIISISFIYILIQEKRYQYIDNIFTKLFLIFYIYILLSSLISENIFFSLKSSIVYLRFGLFTLAVWYIIDNNKNFIRIFGIFLIISFILALFSGFYQYIYGETLLGVKAVNNRLLLIGSDGLLLGHYISRLFPLLVAMLIYNLKTDYKYFILLFILFISSDVIVFISGERTALGLLVIASFFILIMIKKLKLFRLFTLLCSLVVVLLISINNPSIKERNIDYTIKQLGINQESDKINIFSPIHESHLITAWNIFKDYPYFGIGPNNFRKFCDKQEYQHDEKSCTTHPHNTYIQLLSEIGIFGMLPIILVVYYLIKVSINHIIQILRQTKTHFDDYQVCLIACFLCTLWPFFPTLNFFNNWINIIYYLPVGFFLHSIYVKKQE